MGGVLTANIPAGTRIEAAAATLVGAANAVGAEVVATFNGVRLRAKPGCEAAEVVASYHLESEVRGAAYRASPEGKAAARREAEDVAALQARAIALTGRLGDLDFSDQGAVLDYLADLQPCSDRMGVIVHGEAIAAAFERAGFTPNACAGDAFDSEDRDVFFRWLVGQALDGLTQGPAIHGVFHKFAAEWRAKWGSA